VFSDFLPSPNKSSENWDHNHLNELPGVEYQMNTRHPAEYQTAADYQIVLEILRSNLVLFWYTATDVHRVNLAPENYQENHTTSSELNHRHVLAKEYQWYAILAKTEHKN
jgi:hypothetical protein